MFMARLVSDQTVCNNSLKECALQVYPCGGFFSSSLVLISYEDQNDSVKEDHQVTGCCYGKNYPRGASPGDSTPSS